jgi:hypothetical protein
MAMLPGPLQTETRPSDGLAITWVGVSGAIRYGLIIGVQGVPMPDLDVIMRGQTKQFAILGVPSRFTGVVDIGTPAGATRQFGLVAYRSDGGIFPISPLNIFPARSAPRDREYHAVVPPALVEVATIAQSSQSAQPVRSTDPSDPWSALEAASNAAPTPVAPVTFTSPQPSAEIPSFTVSQPATTPTVPHTPAPYDPWDVLSQSAAADVVEEEPTPDPVEEESSAADWAQTPSYTEPTPAYSGYYEAPSQSPPIEPERREEPPIEAIPDKPVAPIEEPARPAVEPSNAFPEPVRFEPYRPAVVSEPEPHLVKAPQVEAASVAPPIETAPVESAPVEPTPVERKEVPPIVDRVAEAEVESTPPTTSAESEHWPETRTSAVPEEEMIPETPVENNAWEAAPDAMIRPDQPTNSEVASETAESPAGIKAEEPPTETVAETVPASAAVDLTEPPVTETVSNTEEPAAAPIADDSGERTALPTANDADYRAIERDLTSELADREDRSVTSVASDSWKLPENSAVAEPAMPAVADTDQYQESTVVADLVTDSAAPAIRQAAEQPTTPYVSPTWAPVETAPTPVTPAPAEPEPPVVNVAAESEPAAGRQVETRVEAPIARPVQPAPIEPEPEVSAWPLPADLGALLDEAELYLLPQWADSDAALSLVEQVEREAPGHSRTRGVRARIESMRSVGVAGADQGDSTQIAGLLEKAGRSMGDRDYWGAVDYYEQALAERPEHEEARVGLAKARLRARWPSQLAGAGGDVAALRALGGETEAEAPDLAGQAYATAFGIQPAPDLLRVWLLAFARAGYGGVLADTARRATQVLEESGRVLPNPSVTAALDGLEQTAVAGGADAEAAINRLCDELVGAGQ